MLLTTIVEHTWCPSDSQISPISVSSQHKVAPDFVAAWAITENRETTPDIDKISAIIPAVALADYGSEGAQLADTMIFLISLDIS